MLVSGDACIDLHATVDELDAGGYGRRRRPGHFIQDRNMFEGIRKGALTLVELLLGTLWTVDLHG